MLKRIAYTLLVGGLVYVVAQNVGRGEGNFLQFQSNTWDVNLDEVIPVLRRFARDLARADKNICDITEIGTGWGGTHLVYSYQTRMHLLLLWDLY